jgi:single-strand DNA-binding protein
MNEMYVTVSGRLVAKPEARITRGGVPFAAFRLASTVRRQNPSTGQYEDAGTNFLNVTAFRSLGANAANCLDRGDPVVVYGRMRVNQWMRNGDIPTTSVEIDAYNIGHDLSYGTTAFTKVRRAQVDQADRLSDPAIQSVHAALEGYDAEHDEYVVAVEGAHVGTVEGAGARSVDGDDVGAAEAPEPDAEGVLSTV